MYYSHLESHTHAILDDGRVSAAGDVAWQHFVTLPEPFSIYVYALQVKHAQSEQGVSREQALVEHGCKDAWVL